MTPFLRCLTVVAALWLAVAGAREPEERHEPESGERKLAERYQTNYQALHRLIAEAAKLETDYLESNDLARFEKAGKAWEVRASAFLRKRLAPFYAVEFDRAQYRGQDLPVGHDAKGRAAYQRIEARKIALKAYLSELRKPD